MAHFKMEIFAGDGGGDPSAPDFNKAKRTNPFALMRSSEANFP